MQRKVPIQRKSNETQIEGSINIDGTGKAKIKTPVGLLTHMLELFTFHGCFDLEIDVKGDTHIDIHHTNEDIGIALGKAFKQALGNNNLGIKRFGYAFAPMESTVGRTVIDISGRGHSTLKAQGQAPGLVNTGFDIIQWMGTQSQDGYNFSYLDHFLESFAKGLGATIYVTIIDPSNDLHTNLETVFKSLGLALDQATTIDPRREGQVPSTKGIID